MDIEYDDVKDRLNVQKHGISLQRAADLTDAVEIVDNRFAYGEQRIIATGLVDGRPHVCVYTRRGSRVRVISLRKANGREANAYRAAQQS